MSESTTPEPDSVMAAITAAVQLGHAGDRAGARAALEALWDEPGDALHRCTIAHFTADVQETVADELRWDQRALAAAGDLTDECLQEHDAAWQVRQLLPSLHLNLADAHRRSGNFPDAHRHLAAALTNLDALPDDDYGQLIRGGAEKIDQALDKNSTAPLVP